MLIIKISCAKYSSSNEALLTKLILAKVHEFLICTLRLVSLAAFRMS
jgi:hypothetical protein